VTAEAGPSAAGPSSDGRGQALVDGLVRLLDLEQIEQNIFRGVSSKVSQQRVFGGQVAGQALVAAGRTVEPELAVHSLHAYFIRPGDPATPILYQVEQVRDGRSFSVRRVSAVQHGETIFTLSASFQISQPGFEHSTSMPDVPSPEELPTLAERIAGYPELDVRRGVPRPFDLRYVDDPPWSRRGGDQSPDRRQRIWMRADGRLPDDPLVHVCALTFASDLTLLDAVLARQGLDFTLDDISGASLDHAMWFHRPFRADEWLLYDSESPSASGSRGLAAGKFFSRDGRHLVTVMQEGLLRVPQ
jgi:acyl-CoA thioesterase-2